MSADEIQEELYQAVKALTKAKTQEKRDAIFNDIMFIMWRLGCEYGRMSSEEAVIW